MKTHLTKSLQWYKVSVAFTLNAILPKLYLYNFFYFIMETLTAVVINCLVLEVSQIHHLINNIPLILDCLPPLHHCFVPFSDQQGDGQVCQRKQLL